MIFMTGLTETEHVVRRWNAAASTISPSRSTSMSCARASASICRTRGRLKAPAWLSMPRAGICWPPGRRAGALDDTTGQSLIETATGHAEGIGDVARAAASWLQARRAGTSMQSDSSFPFPGATGLPLTLSLLGTIGADEYLFASPRRTVRARTKCCVNASA